MSITTKKIELIPIGDEDEKTRVYKYIREGIYNQYRMLNTYMSQIGTLYYSCNRKIDSEEFEKSFEEILSDTDAAYVNLEFLQFGDFMRKMEDIQKSYNKSKRDLSDDKIKEKMREIFRNKNEAIFDIEQAKGLGMSGNCGTKIRQDFSNALKNGLARGERQLPYYKKNFPLLVPSRFLTFYKTKDEYKDKDGNMQEKEIFAIKFVNGIHFKINLGFKGKRDRYLIPLLDSLINDPDNYHIAGSSIMITKKGKIILNLTVKINKEAEKYEPVKGRVMGLAMGYDKCLVAALSDSDKVYTIGDRYKDSIVEKRIKIQEYNRKLQMSLVSAQGSHGRKRKMRNFDNKGSREKNIVQHFNHILSKDVVEFAKKHKVEKIVIEKVDKDMLNDYPVLLRNWTFYQLINFIKYKAAGVGYWTTMENNKERIREIDVIESESDDSPRMFCCKCGAKLDQDNIIPKEIEWCHELYFVCPNCKERIEYSYNKAKNMTVMG